MGEVDRSELFGGEPILNLVGEKVALGPIRRDLLPLSTRWMNDFEVCRNLATGWRPVTPESEVEWYENASRREHDRLFLIYELSTLRPIGHAGLHRIDLLHRTAEYGIFIGEKDCWNRGYGTEVTSLVLDYGFTGLNLHNIFLWAIAFNQGGIRAYEKAGFRVIGRRREAHWLGGRAYDMVFMDCLATEFQSPVLGKLLPEG